MNKKATGTSILILVLVVLCIYLFLIQKNKENNTSLISTNNTSTTTLQTAFDGKNSSFKIDDVSVTLKNGESSVEIAPGSASKVTTKYFGNEATGDLNGDGLPDTAFLVTQEGGGSGVSYYVVVALKTSDGYKTTNAFLIGDRIAPQSTEINSSAMELHVNYADRKANEPMTTQPSVGSVKILKVTPDGKLAGIML